MRSQSFHEMRRRNALSIVAIVRGQGDISRADLARAANLSPATVSSIVDELIEAGVLKETGVKASTRGRRPIGLTFNARSRFVVGISIESTSIRMSLCDLDGNLLSEAIHKHKYDENITLLTNLLIEHLKALLRDMGGSFKRLGAVGIALPGPFGETQASLLDITGAPSAAVEYQRLWALLEKKLKKPIVMDSYVNMAVFAEALVGTAQGGDSVMLVRLGSVVRSAFLVQGTIVHGQRGFAGELGHIPVPGNNRRCRCGNQGCLNTMAMTSVVVEMCSAQGVDVKTVADVLHHARESNNICQNVVSEAARGIGFALAMAVNMLAPHHIVLSGPLTAGGDLFFVPLHATIRRYAVPGNIERCTVSASLLQRRGESVGAALRALHTQIQDLLVDVATNGHLREA